MKPSKQLGELLAAGGERGLGHAERVLVRALLDAEAGDRARELWHQTVRFVREEDMLERLAVVGFSNALHSLPGAAEDSAASRSTSITTRSTSRSRSSSVSADPVERLRIEDPALVHRAECGIRRLLEVPGAVERLRGLMRDRLVR